MSNSSEARLPDFEPPLACVSRVMKNVLPDNIMMTKDARQAFVRAAGIFVFYITHCANDFCREGKRSTMYPQDILNALNELGFEDFEIPLEEFMEAYKQEVTENKKAPKADKSTVDDSMDANENEIPEEGGAHESSTVFTDDIQETGSNSETVTEAGTTINYEASDTN